MTKDKFPNVGYWITIIIGCLCFLSGYIVPFLVCIELNWECTGDVAGGTMLLYGIFVFPIAIFLSLCSFIYLILISIRYRVSMNFSHKIGLIIYLSTFLVGTHELIYTTWESY